MSPDKCESVIVHSLLFKRRVREDFINILKIPLNPPLIKGE
jgi:hypothetical protein